MWGFSTLFMQRLISSLICIVIFVLGEVSACAQEVPSASKPADSKPTEGSNSKKDSAGGSGKTSTDSSLPPPKTKYLPNKNNVLIEVPNDASLEDYYKFLEEVRNKPTGPQPYTISEVDIEGFADDERARLTATFTVRLQQADKDELVPLYFNNAILMSQPTYVGDGEEWGKKDPKQGWVWWFKGKGPHRLKLVFSVPLQKPTPSRHLIVPLPTSAVSHIKLTLPFSSVKTTVIPEQSIVDVKSSGKGKTTVEVTGLGSYLDLSWQPSLDVGLNDVSLEAVTMILAQIEADQIFLKANQKVNSLYGQFDKISVTLPTGSELISLDGPERPTYKIDPENRRRVVVAFKENVSSAQLNWTLRLPAKLKTPVTIDGFVVEEARKHVGMIGLSIAKGLQLTDKRPNSNGTSQTLPVVHAGEFPAAMGSVDRAYKFISQPFKLVTAFDEVKPYFEVKPQLVLYASAQHLVLEGKFDFRVDRNSMNEVVFNWPNYKSEGWTIDPVEDPGVVEGHTVDEKGQPTVRLVKYFKEPFSVHVRAHRHFKSGDEVAFSIPRPKSASRLAPSTLVVVNAENVDTDLTARGETIFHQLPPSALEQVVLPEAARALRANAYRVDTDEQTFGLRVSPQKQRIRTESFVEAKWQDNQFNLVQHLYYNVDYEKLNQVRLTVPPAIDLERCQFSGSWGGKRNVELKPELLATTPGAQRQIQLKLNEPQIGKFEIQASYSIPFLKDTTFDTQSLVTFPFLESSDEAFLQTRVALVQADWFDAEPEAIEAWRPQHNSEDAWEWIADGKQAHISLKLVRSARGNSSGSVSQALIKATLLSTGDGLVRAQFRVSTRVTRLPVQLPPGATAATFFWDAKQLSNHECVEFPKGSQRYIVEPEGSEHSSSEGHLLTIDYHDKFSSTMGLSESLDVRPPILDNCSWNQVYWQIELPTGQHLLTYPPSAATLFRWQRTGLIWSRVSERDSDWLRKWITEGTSGAPAVDNVATERNGNSYLFRQLDSPKPLVFQTLSSPLVLLFGAGFTLLVGFLILRVTVLRHVISVLLLGLFVAIIGLWYSAPLELLLQPMIAGLLLPVAAVSLENWIRKRYESGLLSFDGQGEFPPLQAFGSHYVVRQNDPNEATLLRPALRDSESSLPIESGSGVS